MMLFADIDEIIDATQTTLYEQEETVRKKSDNKQKRKWENGFQRWSDKELQDEMTPNGKCGYGLPCDYCEDVGRGRACVRALNEMCRTLNIRIDYEKCSYEDAWNGSFEV